MTSTSQSAAAAMPGEQAVALMQALVSWGNTTTIILQGGSVFEFKGVFPPGQMAEGYYNLDSKGTGFEGHIKLTAIDRIAFQSRQHRGRDSHAFVFEDKSGRTLFKVFLGRDENGDLLPAQVAAFQRIQSTLSP